MKQLEWHCTASSLAAALELCNWVPGRLDVINVTNTVGAGQYWGCAQLSRDARASLAKACSTLLCYSTNI